MYFLISSVEIKQKSLELCIIHIHKPLFYQLGRILSVFDNIIWRINSQYLCYNLNNFVYKLFVITRKAFILDIVLNKLNISVIFINLSIANLIDRWIFNNSLFNCVGLSCVGLSKIGFSNLGFTCGGTS